MFQITNYNKIVVAIRQQSNILGFHVNVLTEKRPWEEQAEFDLQQSGVLSLEKHHKVVRLKIILRQKMSINIVFESHPLFYFLHCHCWAGSQTRMSQLCRTVESGVGGQRQPELPIFLVSVFLQFELSGLFYSEKFSIFIVFFCCNF